MKCALTAWGNRISPVYDAARELLVVSIAQQTIRNRHYEAFQPDRPDRLVERLQALEVQTFICGAITQISASTIQSGGIELIPFIAGSLDEVLEAYARGLPLRRLFPMPGCGGRRHRRGQCRKLEDRGLKPQGGCSLADGLWHWQTTNAKKIIQ